MLKRSLAVAVISAFVVVSLNAQRAANQPTLTPQNSGTTNLLIAVSPVNSQIVWASGANGTFDLTTDGGQHWTPGVVAGAETLQFRDVQGVSDKIAYLMSIGNNTTDFRIYKTLDGGNTWTIEFQNQLQGAFYDCFAFWTPTRGIAHSDSVKGIFPDLRTMDGTTWQSISNRMPPALPGEASFASSGTCVATQGENNAWIATGGASVARILATTDGGNTWSAYGTPLAVGPAAGGFSVDFRDASQGIVGGGDLAATAVHSADAATSSDGGKTWTLTNKPPIGGAIYGLSYVRTIGGGDAKLHSRNDDLTRAVVATGDKGGAAWTPDEGQTWFQLPNVSGYWAVAFANPQSGWLVGRSGNILKISF